MIVGGMPQAVEKYVETRDFDSVERVKRSILELYRADIMKHAAEYEMKVAQIFDDIPAQLQKHDKKFKVKSGKNYTLSPSKKFRNKYAEQTGTPYILHTSDLKVEGGFVYLPLYMTPLL